MAVRGFNRLIISGRLGADPELNTKSKIPVCQLSVATPGKMSDGEQTVEWVKVVCFGNQAESCSKYLTKGREVLVEGRLQTDRYTGKDGVERFSSKCVANQVHFIGSGGDAKAKPKQEETSESYDFGGADAYTPF